MSSRQDCFGPSLPSPVSALQDPWSLGPGVESVPGYLRHRAFARLPPFPALCLPRLQVISLPWFWRFLCPLCCLTYFCGADVHLVHSICVIHGLIGPLALEHALPVHEVPFAFPCVPGLCSRVPPSQITVFAPRDCRGSCCRRQPVPRSWALEPGGLSLAPCLGALWLGAEPVTSPPRL